MKLLKMGSNLQEDPIGVLEEAGVPEDQVSQLRMAKKLCDDPMEALEMAGLPPQQVKTLKLAKLFKDDPEAAALAQLTPEQRELALKAKKMKELYDDPSKGAAKLGGWMKSVCPDEYKGHLDKVGQGLEMAAELKRKKDEMQISMIEKALAKILE